MDLNKTGKFIATLRKERGLTQKQLAEQLAVSDKTISKWECGNGLPEVSLMLSLCTLFNISVNELLSGERLDAAAYQEKAEENIVTLMRPKDIQQKVMHVAISTLFFIVPYSIIFLAAGKYLPPVAMPIAVFVNLILLTANLAAGITYGLAKKWSKWFLICTFGLHTVFLVILTTLFGMMAIIF